MNLQIFTREEQRSEPTKLTETDIKGNKPKAQGSQLLRIDSVRIKGRERILQDEILKRIAFCKINHSY